MEASWVFRTADYEQATTELRALARKLVIIPYLSRVRALINRARGAAQYEAQFDRAIVEAVRPGDVVWDVGANVGLYTTRLSQLVGGSGRVIAFEPSPACFAKLQRATAACANVSLLQSALSDRAGEASLSITDDPTTGSLFAASAAQTVRVPVAVGDELIAQGSAPVPAVLKIDVEGFEEEVLRGLSTTLQDARCRAVLCEVHFGILDARGQRQAPARIAQQLRECGFSTRWVDSSHLAATRPVRT